MDKNYIIVKNAISKEMADICYKYFLLKRETFIVRRKAKYISPFNFDEGTWEDGQVNNAYSLYGDILFDSLLEKIRPVMEDNTNMKLMPTYSYARIYNKGNVLTKHKDRSSCEISTTLNLGGDPWPIYVEPDSTKGLFNENNNTYVPSDSKGIQIDLEPGDMLIYKGSEIEHWRNALMGDHCAQLFLHYITAKEENLPLLMDERPLLGLPKWFKGYKISNVE